MNAATFVAVAAGLAVGLQGAINRMVSQTWGLATAVLINNLVFFVLGLAFYFGIRTYPESFPIFFRPKGSGALQALWPLLPGLLGFIIVSGIPLAISRLGALKVFVIIVALQILVGILWDFFMEGLPPTPIRATGAALVVLGAFLASR